METPVTVQIVSIGIIGRALLFDTPQIIGSFACLNHQTTMLDAIYIVTILFYTMELNNDEK